MPQLTSRQQAELVEALLECNSVKDRATRDALVDELRPTIRSRIERSAVDRDDVRNIVARCLDFANGLEEFIAGVRRVDEGTFQVKQVDDLILHLFSFGVGESEVHRRLLTLTARVEVNAEELRQIYDEIRPGNVAAEGEPLGLYAIVSHCWRLSLKVDSAQLRGFFPIVDLVERLARAARGSLARDLRQWNEQIIPVLDQANRPAQPTGGSTSGEPKLERQEQRHLALLETVLSGLYPDMAQSGEVVARARLNPVAIAFQERPAHNWHNILQEAQRQQKVAAIIQEALVDFPKDDWLLLAEQASRAPRQAAPTRGAGRPADPWRGSADENGLERIIGRADYQQEHIIFFERAVQRARPVVRVVRGDQGGGMGTGFLIWDNLLLTANYLLPTVEDAGGAQFRCNFQLAIGNLYAGTQEWQLDPEAGFATSAEGGWTAVRVKGDANAQWGFLNLARAEPTKDDRISIVSHPSGGPKQISLWGWVLASGQGRMRYIAETMPGSGGAPVFNQDWELIAMHYAQGMRPLEESSGQRQWIGEGIHVNALIDGLVAAGLYVELE